VTSFITSAFIVFEAAMWIKTNVDNTIVIETLEKEIKEIFFRTNCHLKDGSGVDFTTY